MLMAEADDELEGKIKDAEKDAKEITATATRNWSTNLTSDLTRQNGGLIKPKTASTKATSATRNSGFVSKTCNAKLTNGSPTLPAMQPTVLPGVASKVAASFAVSMCGIRGSSRSISALARV